MSGALKILVCGDVAGKFSQLFKRVEGIQKKAGQFDMLFCVGDFFGDDQSEWEKCKSGVLKAPLPILILGPNKTEHEKYFPDLEGCELCANITYLGKKGFYSGSSGLQVAYLSGLDGTNSVSDATHFSSRDVETLCSRRQNDSQFQGVDILLTSQWSKEVEKYALEIEGLEDTQQLGSAAISQLALNLRPRYHFVAQEGVFYERLPYRNHVVLAEGARHVTRFIALAKVGNPKKHKYLYAFNIVPLKHMDPLELNKQPQDVTECPYKFDSSVIQKKEESEKAAQFFYDLERKPGKQGNKRKSHGDGGPPDKRKPPKPTGPCWFCLGSPEVEKHLVASVGEHTYLALAKGGMTSDHILITPIAHHQSTIAAPAEVLTEIEKYKSALRKCFKSHGKAVVFFERNYKTQHLQIQVVPVPLDIVDEIKETFQGCALSQDIELHEIPKMSDLKQIVPEGAPYFYAELPGGEKLLYRISKGFPLQFGREALAHDSLLNMPDRIDWRNCKHAKEEEIAMTKDFRQLFQDFDFNQM